MSEFEFPQGIYRSYEIPIANYLMSLRQSLVDDFMAGFNSLEEASKRGTVVMDRRSMDIPIDNTYNYIRTLNPETQTYKNNFDSWKTIDFRYSWKAVPGMQYTLWDPDLPEVDWTMDEDEEYAKLYPTAYNLVKEFGKNCAIANYSIMAPNSVLVRHTGPENRSGKYLRVHIPLIIPEGDIFLEVNGEEIDWSDLFGFNNQLAHSSHNLSPHYRLIFLIDLDREFLGLPPGAPYKEYFEKYPKPFLRNGKEWHLYKKEHQ
jgi:hypothetical protein